MDAVSVRPDPNFRMTQPSSIAGLCVGFLLSVATVLADRTPWTASRVVGSPEPPSACRVERVFPGLKFSEPVDLAYEPTTRRWFISLVRGRLMTFQDDATATSTELVADLHDLHPGLSQFSSFTFHPGFATNGLLFAVFGDNIGGTNRWTLARYSVSRGPSPKLDLASEAVVITSRGSGHEGACVRFGPDGMLYASLGDASSPEPPDALSTGQDLGDLMASILRIDVDHPEGGRLYGVPSDNPFVARAGARPEVWAYGFRNPWRMNFGPDGALWVGDVGWELWEMIHRVTRGYNGGWSAVEGPQGVHGGTKPPTPIATPIAAHPHSEASSITGGLFYRGKRMPRLQGAYIYGDYATGKIWALRNDGPRAVSREELCDTSVQIVGFAEAPDGEILMLDHNGAAGIYRLVPNDKAASPSDYPRKLSATGIFGDTAKQEPSPGVQPYTINAEMWHDHATTERWLAVPGTNRVMDGGFPKDTVLVKTLSLGMRPGAPATRRRIETQLLHLDEQGWQASTYRWNDAQTDADLVPANGANTTLEIADAAIPGGRREQSWRFAGRAECMRCHNPWSGTVLAFNPEQLETSPAPGASSFRLLMASEVIGYGKPPGPVTRWTDPHDGSAALDARARSLLHVNCAHCHRFGAGGSVASFFNVDAKLGDLRVVDQKPTRGTFGLDDARVLVPGRPDRSVLWYRLNTESQGHMPHIGSRRVDDLGSRLIASWIESLAPAPDGPAPTPGSTSAALAALRSAQKAPGGPAGATASMKGSTNAFARDLFARFLPQGERRRTLGAGFDPQEVLGLKGDPARGKALFHSETGPQCARCHVVSGQGRMYGPDLTEVRKKFDRAALLENIVEPSKGIAPEFVLHSVETKDGEGRVGFVVASDDQELRLRVESGEVVTLPRSQVVADDPAALSAMPEGLLADLTAQEVADLLAYLSAP